MAPEFKGRKHSFGYFIIGVGKPRVLEKPMFVRCDLMEPSGNEIPDGQRVPLVPEIEAGASKRKDHERA